MTPREWIAKHGLTVPMPDRADECRRRLILHEKARKDKALQRWWLKRCAEDPITWLKNWAWVYSEKLGQPVPFRVSARVEEFVRLFVGTEGFTEAGGVPHFALLEKSREQGATVVCVAASLWVWMFEREPNLITWAALVAKKIDDKSKSWGSSTFAKARLMIRWCPVWMRPGSWKGGTTRFVDKQGQLLNDETGAQISAKPLGIVASKNEESERGTRARRIWIDEANSVADLRRALAVMQSSGPIVLTSSVKGRYTYFAQLAHGDTDIKLAKIGDAGGLVKLRWHYKDADDYDPKRIAALKAKMPAEEFAAEWEIDYSASMPHRIWGEVVGTQHVLTSEQYRELRKNRTAISIHGWDFGQSVSLTAWVSAIYLDGIDTIIIEDYRQWSSTTAELVLSDLKDAGWYGTREPDYSIGDPSGMQAGRSTWNGAVLNQTYSWIHNLRKVGICVTPQSYEVETAITAVGSRLRLDPPTIFVAQAATINRPENPGWPSVMESLKTYARESGDVMTWTRPKAPRPRKDVYSHIADAVQHVVVKADRIKR